MDRSPTDRRRSTTHGHAIRDHAGFSAWPSQFDHSALNEILSLAPQDAQVGGNAAAASPTVHVAEVVDRSLKRQRLDNRGTPIGPSSSLEQSQPHVSPVENSQASKRKIRGARACMGCRSQSGWLVLRRARLVCVVVDRRWQHARNAMCQQRQSPMRSVHQEEDGLRVSRCRTTGWFISSVSLHPLNENYP
jgi:hypothetical protein